MNFKYWASTAVVFVTLLVSCLLNIGLPQSLPHSQYCSSLPIFASPALNLCSHHSVNEIQDKNKHKLMSMRESYFVFSGLQNTLHFVKKKHFNRQHQADIWFKEHWARLLSKEHYCFQIHILKQCFLLPTLPTSITNNPLFLQILTPPPSPLLCLFKNLRPLGGFTL